MYIMWKLNTSRQCSVLIIDNVAESESVNVCSVVVTQTLRMSTIVTSE